ncbi:MAG: dihydrofolate reductase family protein [Verrucomicrobia bacterium]|nr:dihydrofolate reductase family protein [Verrucomicrobiota bacterium]
MKRSPTPRVIVCATLSWDGRVLDPPGVNHDDAALLDPRLLAGLLTRLARHYPRLRQFTATGGSFAAHALLAAGAVDEIHVRLQPRIVGGPAALTLTGPPPFAFAPAGRDPLFPRSVPCRLLSAKTTGQTCLLRYRVLRGARRR